MIAHTEIVSPFAHVITPSGTLLVTIASQLLVRNRTVLKMLVLEHIIGGGRHVRLDFSACSYIDAEGLGVLVSIRKKLLAVQGELALVGLNEDLRTLFDLTKLAPLFGTTPIVAVPR